MSWHHLLVQCPHVPGFCNGFILRIFCHLLDDARQMYDSWSLVWYLLPCTYIMLSSQQLFTNFRIFKMTKNALNKGFLENMCVPPMRWRKGGVIGKNCSGLPRNSENFLKNLYKKADQSPSLLSLFRLFDSLFYFQHMPDCCIDTIMICLSAYSSLLCKLVHADTTAVYAQ